MNLEYRWSAARAPVYKFLPDVILVVSNFCNALKPISYLTFKSLFCIAFSCESYQCCPLFPVFCMGIVLLHLITKLVR